MGRHIVHRIDGTEYRNIQVVDIGDIRYLRFGQHGGWQGALCLSSPERLIFPYQKAFSSLLKSLPLPVKPQRFLSVGVGTGTALKSVVRQFSDCELCGIEIDSTVIDVAIRFFGSPDKNSAQYITGDGVHLLGLMPQHWDLIFVDAYDANQIYMPCLDPTFAATLYNSLGNTGTVVCNVIGHFPPSGAFRQFIDAAMDCFAFGAMLPVGNPFTDQNILLVLSKHPEVIPRWSSSLYNFVSLAWFERLTWPRRVRTLNH